MNKILLISWTLVLLSGILLLSNAVIGLIVAGEKVNTNATLQFLVLPALVLTVTSALTLTLGRTSHSKAVIWILRMLWSISLLGLSFVGLTFFVLTLLASPAGGTWENGSAFWFSFGVLAYVVALIILLIATFISTAKRLKV